MRRVVPVIALGALVLLALMAKSCRSTGAAEQPTVDLYVASSMREPAETLAAVLEAETGAVVVLNVAGSQQLRTMIEHGAPADVFLAADPRHVDRLEAAGEIAARRDRIACNRLVLAVPAADVSTAGIADLPRLQRIVLGVSEVPVGAYADALLTAAETSTQLPADFAERVGANVVSRESNTRQVLARVALGEADAAIVYATDVGLAGGDAVRAVPLALPADATPPALPSYSMAVAAGADADAAVLDAWLELVASPRGQAIFAAHGFATCE